MSAIETCPATQEYGELCGRAVTRLSGFCGLHDPVEVARRKPRTKSAAAVDFAPAQVIETFERQGDFDVWSVYLEDAVGNRIIRWRESLHAGSRQGARNAMASAQAHVADSLGGQFQVERVEEYTVPR